MKYGLIFFLLFLTGCVAQQMQDGLIHLQDKPIETAVTYLGLPDGQYHLEENKVYIWGHHSSGSYLVPKTSTTDFSSTTNVYGDYGSAHGTTHGTASTTSYVSESYDYHCVIKAVADRKGIISYIDYEGNLGGCSAFSGSMKKIADDFSPKPFCDNDECGKLLKWKRVQHD
tara:strand:- start:1922 stop:2434 length:513 start_codon:yes stop_codon:yes gene_type:complete